MTFMDLTLLPFPRVRSRNSDTGGFLCATQSSYRHPPVPIHVGKGKNRDETGPFLISLPEITHYFQLKLYAEMNYENAFTFTLAIAYGYMAHGHIVNTNII